jgi:alkaline phosphatase D
MLKYMAAMITGVLLCNSIVCAADPVLTKADRIAFGSCLRQSKPAPIFKIIAAEKPDVFIWLGDNVYGDSADAGVINTAYATLAALDGFTEFRAATPFLYIWDDHDFGKNDAGAEFTAIEQNKKIMLDFFAEPTDSLRRQRAGNYDAKIVESSGRRVQFILLDTRSFRSPAKFLEGAKKRTHIPNDDPAATILGAAQWEWLEAELNKTADVRIVCSSIQVLPTKHRFEKWANFPRERERLLSMLDPKNTIILSGDRHYGSMMIDPTGSVPPEVTSSSLNTTGKPSPEDNEEPFIVGPAFTEPHYAELSFEADDSVNVRFIDSAGKTVGHFENVLHPPIPTTHPTIKK